MNRILIFLIPFIINCVFINAQPSENTFSERDNDSLRALFIGNSYTFYNDMVKQVELLAASTAAKLSTKMAVEGGWTLKRHANNTETLNAIREGNWDFIVLQEHSKAPAQERELVKKDVYPAAFCLDSLRQEYNSKGRTVFYMTWGQNDSTYTPMQERLTENYLDLTLYLDAWCAPVGMAFKRVREERPDLILYEPDTSHPSLQGSYLAANIFYSVFLNKPYVSEYTAGLPLYEAMYLQKIAQETVFNDLSLWNIQPDN